MTATTTKRCKQCDDTKREAKKEVAEWRGMAEELMEIVAKQGVIIRRMKPKLRGEYDEIPF